MNNGPLIVTLSGLTGSGKTAVAKSMYEILTEKYGRKTVLIAPTFKDLAKEKNMSELEFQKYAENNPNIDKEFDITIIKHIEKAMDEGNEIIVMASWLAPFLAYSTINSKGKGYLMPIWLSTPFNIRVERVAKRESISLTKAIRYINNKESENNVRYAEVYNIVNIEDILKGIATIIVNTTAFDVESIASMLSLSVNEKFNLLGLNKTDDERYVDKIKEDEWCQRFDMASSSIKKVLDEYMASVD